MGGARDKLLQKMFEPMRPLLRKHFQPGVRAALGLRRGRRFTSDTHDDCAARVALGPIGLPSEDFSYRLKDGVAHLNHGKKKP